MERSGTLAAATVLMIMLCVWAPASRAQWEENGTALCQETGEQHFPYLVPLDDGGAVVVWMDYRGGEWDVYAQRIDARGRVQWLSGGVAVCAVAGDQHFPRTAADGAGGAIVAWEDYRSGSADIYAQLIDGNGDRRWGSSGIAICTATQDQQGPRIIADGSGYAIIAWHDSRAGDRDIYAQKISRTGVLQWTSDGICVCAASDNQYACELSPDLLGGAFIVWTDFRAGTADLYGQRVSSGGSPQWTAGGVGVCTAANSQFLPRIITDPWGKMIVSWSDSRDLTEDVYAQKLDRDGTAEWTPQGIGVGTGAGGQNSASLVHDGAGGAVIAWHDSRSGDYDIYAQRVDAWGNALWTANGVAVYAGSAAQVNPDVVSDGVGGAVITWRDQRSVSYDYDVYAQRIDCSGSLLWDAGGVALCTAAGNQQYGRIVTDGEGGAIIAWDDERSGVLDVFAQRIERSGNWGYPAAEITWLRDKENDEGGFVKIVWDASRIDPLPHAFIDYYTIWRAIEPARAARYIEAGALVVEGSPAEWRASPVAPEGQPWPDPRSPIIRMERLGDRSYFWELIDSTEAFQGDAYAEYEPTLFDSTASNDGRHFFQIIAHGLDAEDYWISPPESGYSVDNLPPGAPAGLACEGQSAPEGLSITWNPNPEPDLAHYAIYRGLGPDFTPEPGNLLATTDEESCLDAQWRPGDGNCYKISAIDAHGNEGPCSLLDPGGASDVRPETTPAATYLGWNHPNPFNPFTTIEYGLQRPAYVSLAVYDASGRLVRIIAQGTHPAGHFSESWDGADARGRPVASGAYYIRLRAPGFDKSRTVILVR